MEVVLAIGLVAFALVSILGLFGAGLKDVGESQMKIEAANVAAGILAERLAAPEVNLASSPLPTLVWTNLPSSPTNALTAQVEIGSGGQVVSNATRFRLRYRIWKDVSQTTNSRQVRVHLLFSWPPGATRLSAANQYELLTSTILPP